MERPRRALSRQRLISIWSPENLSILRSGRNFEEHGAAVHAASPSMVAGQARRNTSASSRPSAVAG